MRNQTRMVPVVAMAIAVAVVLSGCRGNEQDRPVSHEKGVYQGQKDTPLSEDKRRELRERTQLGH